MTTTKHTKNQISLYPLRFKPTYKYRLWGGRRLSNLLSTPLPNDIPVGEAWLLSDRDDHASIVANGPLKGQSISQLMDRYPEQLLGKMARSFPRFPLLLKFLDARKMLSVQVHPTDAHKDLLPACETGKSEAWVVLEAGAKSRIYKGLKPGTTAEHLRQALTNGTVTNHLAYFTPKPGDVVFLPAGTVHSMGGDVVVFEIQQNSDVTFRLHDWNRVDARTGQSRELQVDQALACIDFTSGKVGPVTPVVESTTPIKRERLIHCKHFRMWRLSGKLSFTVGTELLPHILICIKGSGQVEHGNTIYDIEKSDLLLLPAVIGACIFRPHNAVTLLEIALPE